MGFCVRGFPIRGPPPLGQVVGSTPAPPINFRSQVTDRACLPTTSGGLRPPSYLLRSRFPLGPAIYMFMFIAVKHCTHQVGTSGLGPHHYIITTGSEGVPRTLGGGVTVSERRCGEVT